MNSLVVVKGYVLCLGGYISVVLLSYSTSSSVLDSLDLLLSCSVTTVALHNSIILIITPFIFYQPINRLINTGTGASIPVLGMFVATQPSSFKYWAATAVMVFFTGVTGVLVYACYPTVEDKKTSSSSR